MPSVLVVFAHPALETSRINVRLLEVLPAQSGVTFHDLYETYPDFDIDITAEQARLREHDIIVVHHPFYWYSAPPLVKQWLDLVLEHGWAYGSGGDALTGKQWLQVVTAGGPAAAYTEQGLNRYSVREYLRPFEGTAQLCGMTYLPPFILYGAHGISDEQLAREVDRYRLFMTALTEEGLDRQVLERYDEIPADITDILATGAA